jgi:hypothetical protein
MSKLLHDLTGKRFGRLFVLRRISGGTNNAPDWLCRCDCGIEKEIRSLSLRHGFARSCGCSKNERQNGHGHSAGGVRTATYIAWESLMQRCFYPGHKSYAVYGGAGITVCDEWREFRRFLADMGERPIGTTLDRIDGTRGYYRSNCRWATPAQQKRNQKVSIYVTFRGERRYLKDVADETGTPYYAAWRWHKKGILEEKLGNFV